jgi:phosphate starvation-inducible PhoH-like protein
MVSLLGAADELLKLVEGAFDSQVFVRGNQITVTGERQDTERVARLFEELLRLLDRGTTLTPELVTRSIEMINEGASVRPSDVFDDPVLTTRGKSIKPRTLGQKRYVDAIRRQTVVFGIGPAGTGKTYLAMAVAVQALLDREINRIILTRPAVEAGEKLGFLPGTLSEKIDPYVRPLYDALYEMIDGEQVNRLMERGTIEVAPLGYMRGRAQPYSSQVLTPDGFRPIGSLEVGDLVVGSDGLPTPVLGVYPQGRKEVYRVRTQDGASTRCCGEHLWAVSTRHDRARGRPRRVLETREMIGRLRAAHAPRFELPLVSQPVELPSQDVPMDPYALGLLLGDGVSRVDASGTPVTARPLVHHGAAPRGVAVLADPAVRPGSVAIPAGYLHNTAEVRAALLQGLLDAGGQPVALTGRTCLVRFTACSARLRDDVKIGRAHV